jgi:site-specific recombinase XerD
MINQHPIIGISYSSLLSSAGIDLNSIRQIAGHSSISTTQRYIDDNPYKIADILEEL